MAKGKHAKKRKSLGGGVFQVAGMLMITMSISRVLGYVRDVVMVGAFGMSSQTDAYTAAFQIPDFFYYILVGGALSSAFIPIFSGYIANKQEEDGWTVASTVINIVLIAGAVLIALGLIFTPQLVELLVKFKDDGYEESFALTVLLTRVMFAQSFFMCLSGISQGILHSYKRFTAPAIGSMLYNLAIVIVGMLFSEKIGILAFTLGVVFGAFLNFAVQIPDLLQIGFKYRPIMDFHHPGVQQFFRLLGPVLLGLSVTHLNLFITTNLGSGLGEGIITALHYAQRIMQLPVGIFAIAIAVAVFPTMTSHAARGEMDLYLKDLSLGFRTIIFITLPAAVGLAVLRFPIVRAMYLLGKGTLDSVEIAATALFFYCLGLVGYSAQQLLNRGFYALQDSKTTVVINVMSIIVNIVLSFALVMPLGYIGLATAYSISGLVSMFLLLLFLRRKLGHMDGRRMLQSALQCVLASAVMAAAVLLFTHWSEGAWDMTNKMVQIMQVLIGVLIGAGVYGAAALGMRMEETELVLSVVKRKAGRR